MKTYCLMVSDYFAHGHNTTPEASQVCCQPLGDGEERWGGVGRRFGVWASGISHSVKHSKRCFTSVFVTENRGRGITLVEQAYSCRSVVALPRTSSNAMVAKDIVPDGTKCPPLVLRKGIL